MPAIVFGLVLLVATGAIWAVALSRPIEIREASACNPPPVPADGGEAPNIGEKISHSAMADSAPAKLADTNIRVLNASGRGGQAAETAGALYDLGFAQPTAENDPVYTDIRLQCQGQIRFGPAGKAAAAALWLVAPCVELYQDGREDNAVDLALGTDFTSLVHNADIDTALADLRPEAANPPDKALLSRIHSDAC